MKHDAPTILNRFLRNPVDYGIRTVVACRPMSGGLVHHVWEVETPNGKFFVKIRGRRFASIPNICSNPRDTAFEAKATSFLNALLPDCFPTVVCSQPDEGLLIVTDVMRGGETLDASLRKRSLSLARAERLGETVRRIHQCAASARFSIRGHGDKAFFAAKLNHKLGFGDNPVLHQLIAELSCQQPRQIILGDPSPKNIAIARDSDCFRFFDLEDVHRGNVVFDVGFLAGHFLLHTHDAPERAAQLVERFLRGYGHQVLDARLLKTTALGAVMYRLASPVVPYQTDLSTSMKREFLKAVEKVLGRGDLETLSWRNLVFHALAFQ